MRQVSERPRQNPRPELGLGTQRHDDDTRAPHQGIGALACQFLVGIYGGYFGAGIGILMLAALGLLGFSDIHRMNGLKNVLAILINGVAAEFDVARAEAELASTEAEAAAIAKWLE